MPKLSIRPAVAADADEITRIYVESWNEGFGDLMPAIVLDPARIERWRADLSLAPPHRWWLAERADSIVGFVGIGPCRDPVDARLGELDTIAVEGASWRTGVGRELMAKALHWLRSDGYQEAVLWTLAGYARGAGFYGAMGWRPRGESRNDGTQILYTHPLRHVRA